MTTWEIIIWVLIVIAALIGGFFFGARYSKKKTEQYLKENPPISEKQIRAMYLSMGRKPSEAQIQRILKQMKIK